MADHVAEFVRESEDRIDALNAALLDLESGRESATDDVFRIAHTLKGNCAAMGLTRASGLAHAMEDVLDAVRSGDLPVDAALLDALFDAVDSLESMIAEVDRHGDVRTDPAETIEALRELLPASIAAPTDDEIDALLERADPPDDEHGVYVVRIAIDPPSDGGSVVDALEDAFDVLATEPPRAEIEGGDYDGTVDAAFASPVGEGAIAAALGAVDPVAAFEIVAVTGRFAGDGPDAFDAVSRNRAREMDVDELLEAFDDLDDLDAMVEEVDDVGEFDDLGSAGSFDDVLSEDVEPTFVDEPATDDAADDPGDASDTFDELKSEVETVEFEELREELEDLEFEEFDEEVSMDELLDDPTDAGASDASGADEPAASDASEGGDAERDAGGDEPAAEPDLAFDADADEFDGSDGFGADADALEIDGADDLEAFDGSFEEFDDSFEEFADPDGLEDADAFDADEFDGVGDADEFDRDSFDDPDGVATNGIEFDADAGGDSFGDDREATVGTSPDADDPAAVPAPSDSTAADDAPAARADDAPTSDADDGTGATGDDGTSGAGDDGTAGAGVVAGEAAPDVDRSVRVDVERIDSLLTLVQGLVTSRVRLRHALEDGADEETLAAELEDLESLVEDLREAVMDVRLVPLRTATSRLPRVVRDAARETDTDVVFETSGEDVELDRAVLDRIGDPLTHLVRNAVDHGIEPPAEREARGKPPTGTVELRASRSRGRVEITVEDDGRGLDADELRSAAVEAGVRSAAEAAALSEAEAYELIFEPGLSTAEEVTDVSGRGVGMDAVERVVDDLGGSVSVRSEPGEGTAVTMEVPVTVAVDEVLFVERGGETFGVPVDAVASVEDDGPIETVAGEPVLGDEEVPVVDLAEALDVPDAGAVDDGMAVRIRDGLRRVALRCDAVHDQRDVVVDPFDGFMRGLSGLDGATIRGRGEVVPILDVSTL